MATALFLNLQIPRFKRFLCSPTTGLSFYCVRISMDCHRPSKGKVIPDSLPTSCSVSPSLIESLGIEGLTDAENNITLEEWQGWGTTSPLPPSVVEAIEYLKALERQSDAQMSFGGKGGKLLGDFRSEEDKKHRATYRGLIDSESKFRFFAARQVACRLLGSRGYLCQKCWLAMDDCMCSKITPLSLWRGIKFWLYMHPKDFLRQNNTGKLLWQNFGIHSSSMCIYGIPEHEDIMWNEFKNAGKDKVYFLYPNRNSAPMSVQDYFSQDAPQLTDCLSETENSNDHLNFVLIDGTWNNSAAMFMRLKDRAKLVWGEDDLSCISLSAGASAMHKLRPQPSWDRTCTAAAAADLLFELHLLPKFSSHGLEKQGEVLEDSLEVLLEALTSRRTRTGRSIIRKVRGISNIY